MAYVYLAEHPADDWTDEILSRHISGYAGIAHDEAGKPYVIDHPAWHISLSEDDGCKMLAVATVPIGCDIERIQPLSDALRKRVFTADEYRQAKTAEAQLRIWTAKEAYGKYRGTGIDWSMCNWNFASLVDQDTLRQDGIYLETWRWGMYQCTVCRQETKAGEEMLKIVTE